MLKDLQKLLRRMQKKMMSDFNSSVIIRELNAVRKSNGEKDAFEDTVQTVINKSVKSVGKTINDIEKQIQDHFPDIKYIDLEIN